jgi:hypothetical protein
MRLSDNEKVPALDSDCRPLNSRTPWHEAQRIFQRCPMMMLAGEF